MTHHGRFVWYDLMTTDVGAALRFYSTVIGWETRTFDMGGEPYPMFAVGDTTVGGSVPATDGPPGWMAYLSTHDLDATVRRARELGASVLAEPADVPTVGRFAVLADPQGVAFSAFEPLDEPEDPPAAPGFFSWHELVTTDAKAGLDFYMALFDWHQTDEMDMGGMGSYRLFAPEGGEHFGGAYDLPPSMKGVPPHWLHYVAVEDIEDAVRKIRENGGQVLNGPMDVPGGGRVAQALDPQGAAFAVHQEGPPSSP